MAADAERKRREENTELREEVKRLANIVSVLEDGCCNCKHPKDAEEMRTMVQYRDCQINALKQVVSEREEKIAGLLARIRQENGYVGSGMDYDVIKNHFETVDSLVEKFLAWPLPKSVCADMCATRPETLHRSGTNLLTATEAKEMFEYLLGKKETA